jgi:hypothetical protein
MNEISTWRLATNTPKNPFILIAALLQRNNQQFGERYGEEASVVIPHYNCEASSNIT